MCVAGGGSRPFLDVLMSCWSFGTPPHLELPILLGMDPRELANLQSLLGGGFVPSCACLHVLPLLLIASGRGTAILALQPPAPHGGSGNWLSPPHDRGEMLKTSGCAPQTPGGWRRGLRFIPGTLLLGLGVGRRSPRSFPCSSILSYTPVRFSPLPPFLRVPRGALASAQHRSTQLPISLALAPFCPLRPLLGFDPTEDLSLKTSAWPRFGFRILLGPFFCSGDYMRLLPLLLFSPCNLLVNLPAPPAGAGELAQVPSGDALVWCNRYLGETLR